MEYEVRHLDYIGKTQPESSYRASNVYKRQRECCRMHKIVGNKTSYL